MAGAPKSPLYRYGTIPPSLRPLIRAYALGYITVTGPRLFGFLRLLSRRDISISAKLNLLYTIVKTSAEPNRFPAACAITVGGATALPRLIKTIMQWLTQRISPKRLALLGPKFTTRLRFITTFLSAYLAFNLLNRDGSWSRKRALSISQTQSRPPPYSEHPPHGSSPTKKKPKRQSTPTHAQPELAGKTIDLTIFLTTRAIDTLILTLWHRTKHSSHHPTQTHPRLTRHLTPLLDPLIFSLSAARIMFSWFYTPQLLPKSYTTWISTAAQIDPGLIDVLRRARAGVFLYGVDTGQAHVLVPLCRKLGLPVHWADPKITVPVPCELYHSGVGPSCEVHALHRFIKSWLFAAELYLPLALLGRLMNPQSLRDVRSWIGVAKSTGRSASFLALFVASFYYAVCLARTRVGPRLFSLKVVSRQMWDSGLCVMAGCLVCGWSILLETPPKRQELAFFVAPRALGTLLPRVYEKKEYVGRERVAFAASVALLLTAGLGEDRKGRVRGVFGRLLERVLREG